MAVDCYDKLNFPHPYCGVTLATLGEKFDVFKNNLVIVNYMTYFRHNVLYNVCICYFLALLDVRH